MATLLRSQIDGRTGDGPGGRPRDSHVLGRYATVIDDRTVCPKGRAVLRLVEVETRDNQTLL